ncbi:hypothetical protein [Methylomonas sp. MgM2]
MSAYLPFQLQNFANYCDSLRRVGIDPGFVLFTNHHASDNKPAARPIFGDHIDLAKSYIQTPSDEGFRKLVSAGVLYDTQWDRQTKYWEIISFEGWETLHKAFSHLHAKASQSLTELTGVSDVEFIRSI